MLNSEEMQARREEADFELTAPALESALFFETPPEIFARVFRALRPRTPPPQVAVEFRPYANANSTLRLEAGRLVAWLPDVLEGAPAPVLEALAFILLAKLYRRPVPPAYAHRYRLYLNRRDIRGRLALLRQLRGRKQLSGPRGQHHDLEEIFEELNRAYFGGLLARPTLSWSRRISRSMLGHYDPSHNAIIISRIFDQPGIPRLGLEYVLFHEMLHLRYPVDHRGARRRVHTREFREAEKAFPRLGEAKALLKHLY
jgi:hypothetical protein